MPGARNNLKSRGKGFSLSHGSSAQLQMSAGLSQGLADPPRGYPQSFLLRVHPSPARRALLPPFSLPSVFLFALFLAPAPSLLVPQTQAGRRAGPQDHSVHASPKACRGLSCSTCCQPPLALLQTALVGHSRAGLEEKHPRTPPHPEHVQDGARELVQRSHIYSPTQFMSSSMELSQGR